MRFLILGLALTLLFVFAQAGFSFGGLKGTSDDTESQDTRRQKIKSFKDQLKSRKMKPNDVLNQTKGSWKDLQDDDTLLDAAADECNITINGDSDRAVKRRKFNKGLDSAQNLTNKHKNARFGITPFSFMDFDEFKQNYMMKPMSTDNLPVGTAEVAGKSRKKRAATSIDLRTQNAVAPIRNQGNCGGCWSFATATTMETAHFKKTGVLLDLAEQQFINCDKSDSGCNGGWMSTAYTYAKSAGVAQESTNPYKAKQATCTTPTGTTIKVSNYTQLKPKDTTSIINVLSQGYSLAVAMKSGTQEFMYYTGGILDDPTDCPDSTVDHAVAIVGYGTANGIDYWIVRNSWGTGWGEAGYVRVKRGINYCNIETYPFFVTTT
ncbi:hypothetical protein FO519_007993 [Halicephalobus sp. NKZ332]|nr:hypothetical protein FO519_007993 [Halicephalobus sp. NKZ332]